MSTIEDELAIRSLAAAYTDAVNRGDLEAMVNVYTVDGVLKPFGGDELKGRDKIRAVVGQTISAYEWIFQMTHSGLVRLDGDVAHCRWWVSEISYKGDGSAVQFFGLYQDRVVRTGEGWRFARRRLDPTFLGRTELAGKHYDRPPYEEQLWP